MPSVPHRSRPGRIRVPDSIRGARASRARGARVLPLALPVVMWLGACSDVDPGSVPAAGNAPGAVLLVNDVPLAAQELETLCRDIRALYPEYSPLHARRLALTNEYQQGLPSPYHHPESWRAAPKACEAACEGGAEPVPVQSEGRFKALGLGVWSAARHQPLGEWSAPLEFTGRWLRVRLDGRNGAADPLLETLQVSVLEFPYVDPERAHAEIEGAIDRARLTLLDPEFAEAVPESWKYRMRGAP